MTSNHFESGWSMVAQNIGDVIFISEVKEYVGNMILLIL